MWKDDGYGVSCSLEILYKGVYIWRGLVGRRTVVVHNLLLVSLMLSVQARRIKAY